ncbi:MAG TPA: bifunctional transaldolase/phosoglucose isomerase [Bryobacteraceae bacterium]|jgi:glucose-6-phosphate isomerase|nr:bifunctional transaldolase/phosoglucose isomerase [Bryobacteraceae bacterium]
MSSAKTLPGDASERFSFKLPASLQTAVKKASADWEKDKKTQRLWQHDASLWTGKDESKWLGWLDIIDQQLADASKFKALTAEVQEDGFKHLLLLGMGGSSLAPEVFSLTFGKQPASPELLVLDSTDPVQIRSFREKIDPARTLFCVSSKSGTTLEPNIYMQYFFEETRKAIGERAGHHFIAVTDPGSKLEGVAAKLSFRRVYHGLTSIGGRYSALSDFGLVPHAAAGLDTEKLLQRAKVMVEACKNDSVAGNPGVSLGLILGTAAANFGRDKATLICSQTVHDLGAWLEQLLAESTGKAGRGLIPVDREPFTSVENYGKDRVIAYIKYSGDSDEDLEQHVADLEAAGMPVIRIIVPDVYDLAQVFFQWEIATAVAGSVIGIDAFDQPDVEASKLVTRQLTTEFEKTGSLPAETPILEQSGIKLFTDKANAEALGNGASTLGAVIRQHLDRIKAGDYFGLLAYIPMFPHYEEKLQEIRKQVLESKQVATVLGFGPRFLHSTGQAYKGGPNSGVFLQITCDEAKDLPVPQQKYTFGIVKAAQARGDFEVLAERKRRALRVHLGPDLDKGLDQLHDLVAAAVSH